MEVNIVFIYLFDWKMIFVISSYFVCLRFLLRPVFVFMLRLLLLLLLSLLLLSSELLLVFEMMLTTVLSKTNTKVIKLEIEKQFLPKSLLISSKVDNVSFLKCLATKSKDCDKRKSISIWKKFIWLTLSRKCVEVGKSHYNVTVSFLQNNCNLKWFTKPLTCLNLKIKIFHDL